MMSSSLLNLRLTDRPTRRRQSSGRDRSSRRVPRPLGSVPAALLLLLISVTLWGSRVRAQQFTEIAPGFANTAFPYVATPHQGYEHTHHQAGPNPTP